MTEDEMGGWHHQPDGGEFEQAPGEKKKRHSTLNVFLLNSDFFTL